MQRTLDNYTEEISDGLSAISEQGRFFFCAWCCEHLYAQYGKSIPDKLSQKDYKDVANLMNVIWRQVDDFGDYDEEDLDSKIDTIQGKDPDAELDEGDTVEFGISNLLGIIENTLMFLSERNLAYVAGAAEIVTDVIDCIMTNDLGLDTANPDKHFNHPLMKEEVDRQIQLINHLKTGAQLTSKDKKIFR